MSSLLRLARTLRPTALSRRPITPNFFNPTPAGLRTGPSHQILPTRRPFSSYNNYGRDNSSINMKLIYGIIGLNCSIYTYSLYAHERARQGDPKPYVSFLQNFTVNLNGFFGQGHYWTGLTSVFTHMNFMHLLGNMVSFYYMAQLVAYTPSIGPGRFLTLVVGSGLAGTVGFLYTRLDKAKATGGIDHSRGLGFSGALMGVGAAAAAMYPKVTFRIYGIIPVPLGVLVAGYAIIDGLYLNDPRSRVAHEGHLGGMAFGLLYYLLKIRRIHLSGL